MVQAVRLAAGIAVLLLSFPALSSPFDWTDNSVAYRYSPYFREPGISKNGKARDIPKHVISLSHSDGWEYGGNLVILDILKSSSADPAKNSSDGAVELYGVLRSDFSIPRILGDRSFRLGPVKDVMIELGGDLNTKDTTFGSRKRMPVAGLAVALDVPGYWTLAALWDKEWNHNGVVGRPVTFNSTARFETSWGIPFRIGEAGFTFTGFGIVNGPKGRDGFNQSTRTETLLHAKLLYDLGALFNDPGRLKAGFGWQYWHSKFGSDHTANQGSIESAPFLEVQVHF